MMTHTPLQEMSAREGGIAGDRFSGIRMHGLGNRFVILDARVKPVPLTPKQMAALSPAGVATKEGVDQWVILEHPDNLKADVRMRIFNADGSEVNACGNASRCVAFLVSQERAKTRVLIETQAAKDELLVADVDAKALMVAIDMGKPKLEWRQIPLSRESDTLHVNLSEGMLSDPVCVSMGNPHAVFFVEDVEHVPLQKLGPVLEHHPIFPERANIGVAQVMDRGTIHLRVFERGVGETLACGTGACAAAVAAIRRKLTAREVTVFLPGGALEIQWRSDEHVIMKGPVSKPETFQFKI